MRWLWPELMERIDAFLRKEGSGDIVLHVKDGQVQSWEIREAGRRPIAEPPAAPHG